VVLGDRHFCSYTDLARLNNQGVFVVYRCTNVGRLIFAMASGWAQ